MSDPGDGPHPGKARRPGALDPSPLIEDSEPPLPPPARPRTRVAAPEPEEESSALTVFGGEPSFSTMSTDGGTVGATQSSDPHDPSGGTALTANLTVGAVVSGYALEGELGAGTFAEVFRARDLRTGRPVALKVLRKTLAFDEGLRRRVVREGEILRSLRHPNIVEVQEVGLLEDGRAFMAMEILQGRTLRELLTQEAPLHPERAFRFLEQIARGLAAAHAAGVVHRDLKPANIFVAGRPGHETLKLLDFGLARMIDRGDFTQLTRAGDLIGSPAFMAPEQIRDPTRAGPRADLYALGVTAYAMLAGRLPFTGTGREVLQAQEQSEPPALPPLAGLELVVAELMHKDPEARTRSAADLLAQLQALSEPTSELSRTWLRPEESAAPVLVAPVVDAASQRERALLASTVVLAVALVAAVGLLVYRESRPTPMATPPAEPPPVRAVVATPAAAPTPEPAPVAPEPEPRAAPTRPPSPRTSPPVERRPVNVRVQPELRRALKARALRMEDARALLPGRSELASPSLPRDELDALLAAVHGAPLSKPVVRARLARVLAKLETLSALEPRPAEFSELESRYLRLRELLVGASSEEKLEALNQQAEALETALDRAGT